MIKTQMKRVPGYVFWPLMALACAGWLWLMLILWREFIRMMAGCS